MTNLSNTTSNLVDRLCDKSRDRKVAAERLVSYCGAGVPFCSITCPDSMERARFAALKLSGGGLVKPGQARDLVKTDWRDLLMEAGFGHGPRTREQWYRNPAGE